MNTHTHTQLKIIKYIIIKLYKYKIYLKHKNSNTNKIGLQEASCDRAHLSFPNINSLLLKI